MTLDELVVELVLDPSKLNEGQRKAIDGFKKTKDEALKQGKEVESAAKRSTDVFGGLEKRLIGLAALFFGASGIKEFATRIVSTDAAMGRFSRGIGQSVSDVARWSKAVELAGGSTDDVTSSMQQFSDTLERYKTFGTDSPLIGLLNKLGSEAGIIIDLKKPLNDVFSQIFDALQKIEAKTGSAHANFIGRQLGLTPGLVNLGLQNFRKLLADADKIVHVTNENAAQSERLLKAWVGASGAAEDFGRTVLNDVAPALEKVLGLSEKLFTEGRKTTGGKIDTLTGILSPTTGIILLLRKALRGEINGEAIDEALRGVLGGKGSIFGSGAGPGSGDGLRVKSGAGNFSLGTAALAHMLQESIPDLKQFTSADDAFHKGSSSKHAQGLALDFSLNDPSKSAQVVQELKRKLAAMGINATVLDEYLHPSSKATAGHVHVNFGDAAAADRFRELFSGASGAAATTHNNQKTSSVRSETNIGQITVNSPADSADRVVRDIGPAVQRAQFALQSNYGQV